MTKYYCDYCDIFLTHDAPRVRKDHNSGWKHSLQVRAHFMAVNQDKMMRSVSETVKDYEVRRELVPIPAPMLMVRPPQLGPGGPGGPVAGMRPPMIPTHPGMMPPGAGRPPNPMPYSSMPPYQAPYPPAHGIAPPPTAPWNPQTFIPPTSHPAHHHPQGYPHHHTSNQ